MCYKDLADVLALVYGVGIIQNKVMYACVLDEVEGSKGCKVFESDPLDVYIYSCFYNKAVPLTTVFKV